jgi:hypothetical protein
MPINSQGQWVPVLSEADKRAAATQLDHARFTAATASLGRIPDPGRHFGDPTARVRAALTGLYRTAETLLPNYGEIRTYEDRDLLHDAQEAERGARLSALQTALDHRAKTLADHAAGALESAKIRADKHRPQLNPEDMAQLIRTDQAWNNFIRPQLDAGKSWPDVMKSLDTDGVLAVQRYAPAYVSSKLSRTDEDQLPAQLAGIQRMTDQRLIQVASEGEAREALQQHADVQRMHDVVQSAAGQLTSLGTLKGVPRNEVVASTQMGVKYVAHQAGAELGEPADS